MGTNTCPWWRTWTFKGDLEFRCPHLHQVPGGGLNPQDAPAHGSPFKGYRAWDGFWRSNIDSTIPDTVSRSISVEPMTIHRLSSIVPDAGRSSESIRKHPRVGALSCRRKPDNMGGCPAV